MPSFRIFVPNSKPAVNSAIPEAAWSKTITSDIVPRIGEQVDFYSPLLTVERIQHGFQEDSLDTTLVTERVEPAVIKRLMESGKWTKG
jgi:hypothetical protein